MKIGGLQKTSLLDYPDTICAIIWTVGCNFNCPFCYNPQLVNGTVDIITEGEIFSFLKKRKGVLEGLSISGGEPFLQKDLKSFCKKVKKLGYKIKIDTNGTFPDKLKELIDNKLIDYIAMDVKAPKKKYNEITDVKVNIKKIEQSINLIKQQAPDYEFKTTFVPDLLKKEDIIEIAKWIKGADKYYLQQFKNTEDLLSSKLNNKEPYSVEYLRETLDAVKSYFNNCNLRGI